MKAWIYQDTHQLKKLGQRRASWYVGWIDPAGKRRCKSCGAGGRGQRNAERFRQKTEAELITGTYQAASKKTWKEFRADYDARILAGMKRSTRQLTTDALRHFERIIRPVKMAAIRTQTIDEFVAKRRVEKGTRTIEPTCPSCQGLGVRKAKGWKCANCDENLKPLKSTVSPATVNQALRHLKAVLGVAHDWGYLPVVPKFRMVREPGRLPTFITPEDFAAIYQACDKATMPANMPGVVPAEWWRALLVMAYMTGWRISELLALHRNDVDLEAATALTRAEDNKRRDELVKLHPVVVAHLRRLPGFDPCYFTWNYDSRTLYVEFARIQIAAKVKPVEKRQYGFHDLRRAFATMNADRLTADALQSLMRHKSYLTTKKYINMTRQIDEAVNSLHVPEVLRRAMG